MNFVVPAVLPSSKRELDEKLELLGSLLPVKRIQIDVVDGRLAVPASWPYTAPEEMQALVARGGMLPSLDRLEYEIDLMCFDALSAAEQWLALGASRLTFHTESSADLPDYLAAARERLGSFVTFGLALNINSSLGLVRACAGELGYVQFMGIARIGRQGEPFDERVLEKIKTFRRMYPSLPVQVDGGVSLVSAKKLSALGVANLVIGSGILKADDPLAAVEKFETLQGSFGV